MKQKKQSKKPETGLINCEREKKLKKIIIIMSAHVD